MKLYWIKYLSFKKIVNLFKIYLGYYSSVLLKKVIVYGYPYSLTTEPTNKCNLKCPECPTGNNLSKTKKGFQDFNIYKKIIDELKDFAIYQMIYFQGEPFLHQDLFKMIQYADQNKVITTTSTNGHYLSEQNCQKIVSSGLKKIIISLDGINQEVYEKYRIGGSYKKVIEGIENLLRIKRKSNSSFPFTEVQFLVFKHNEHQINEFKKTFKQLGVDKVKLKSAQIEGFEKRKDLSPTTKRYARYSLKNLYEIKSKWKNRCFRVWSTIVINWQGNVLPCCFDKHVNYIFGNIELSHLKKIWKSTEFNSFRRSILLSRKKNDICRNCSEGLRIKY